MTNENRDLTDEESILDELRDTEVARDYTGMLGTAIICLTISLPMYLPDLAPHAWIIFIIGLGVLSAPNFLKWRETSINDFIGSETYFGDGDIYEQFAVKDIMTVVAAAEPFPFAEFCYAEEDIEKYITDFGGTPQISKESINERIDFAIAKEAALIAARPSIIRTLKFSLRNNRFINHRFVKRFVKRFRKEKDTSVYKLTEDVVDE